MSEPTLQDCINYMRSQIKQMEKHPRSYEFNLPYYRKTVELLERRKTNDETFEWCHDCKEYDQKNHCCHRWTKVIRDTVDELEKDRRPHGEWIPCSERLPDKIGDYIVSDIYGQVYSSTFDYVLKEKCFGYDNDDRDFVKDDTVVAWMPLPKPYQKEGEQNEVD